MITLGAGLHPNVPMEAYNDNCCPGPSVSGSTLFRLHSSCPAKALASHYLSPWPPEDDETEAKAFGSAAHCYLIEGEEAFGERYAIKPEDMSFATKEGKAWKAKHEGREIVTHKEALKIAGMALGLQQNEGTAQAFTEGAAEMTAIWQDPETKVWLKARPDWLRPKLAINYKTTRSAAREDWTRQAWQLGYCVSAALCVDIMKALDQPVHYCFVTQEKTVPYLATARVLADDHLEAGRMIYRRALRTFADCIAAGKWPGYSEGVETIPYPAWAERTLANMESPT